MQLRRSLICKFLVLTAFVLFSTGFADAVPLHFLNTDDAGPGSDPDKIGNIFDSTFSSAWDIYLNTWDTEVLNPYQYDFNSFNQPVNICLTADSLGFVMPVINPVTSGYGHRRGRQHQGVDIDLETGDTVMSAFDGVVRMSRYYYGYGNMVVVRHYNGLETLYGHLSRVLVEPGQQVRAGESIGLGGNTGHSFGSHLHFEIRFMGQPIDPGKFIAFDKFSLLNNEVLIDSSMFDNGKLIRKPRSGSGKSAQATASSKKSGSKVHVVRQGDTLSGIARRYHTTVKNLCKLNRIRPERILSLGQRIRVR